ncbi:unnamed protein product [Prunus armeniaca]
MGLVMAAWLTGYPSFHLELGLAAGLLIAASAGAGPKARAVSLFRQRWAIVEGEGSWFIPSLELIPFVIVGRYIVRVLQRVFHGACRSASREARPLKLHHYEVSWSQAIVRLGHSASGDLRSWPLELRVSVVLLGQSRQELCGGGRALGAGSSAGAEQEWSYFGSTASGPHGFSRYPLDLGVGNGAEHVGFREWSWVFGRKQQLRGGLLEIFEGKLGNDRWRRVLAVLARHLVGAEFSLQQEGCLELNLFRQGVRVLATYLSSWERESRAGPSVGVLKDLANVRAGPSVVLEAWVLGFWIGLGLHNLATWCGLGSPERLGLPSNSVRLGCCSSCWLIYAGVVRTDCELVSAPLVTRAWAFVKPGSQACHNLVKGLSCGKFLGLGLLSNFGASPNNFCQGLDVSGLGAGSA